MPQPSRPNASTDTSDEALQAVNWIDKLNATDWSLYANPQTIISTVVLTGATLFIVRLYRHHLGRIPRVGSIEPKLYRRKSLLGRVTSVGDGDNFRLFHTPGGRLAGWGWLPGRRFPKVKDGLKDETIHIRLAGIDAPELAHFGRPSQPFSKEAIDWLRSYILHQRVRAYVYKRDQYDRAVATVYVRKWMLRRDVGLQMLRKGLATVYEAKSGGEFGGLEAKYRMAERWAKWNRRGMWGGEIKHFESPRNYKTRMKNQSK